MRNFFRSFMQGRYGTDKLNLALLFVGLGFSILSYVFVWLPLLNLLFTVCSFGCMILVVFRCFSRNTYKRYRENRRFFPVPFLRHRR